jgi:hypothetical protein
VNIVLSLLLPAVLIILKFVIHNISSSAATARVTLLYFNGSMRIFILYFSFVFNIMSIMNPMVLIYDISEYQPLEKAKAIEENIVSEKPPQIKRKDTSPKKPSLVENNAQNRFPVLVTGKVKLPIFVSFDLTNVEIGRHIFIIQIQRLTSFWMSLPFFTTMTESTIPISRSKYL